MKKYIIATIAAALLFGCTLPIEEVSAKESQSSIIVMAVLPEGSVICEFARYLESFVSSSMTKDSDSLSYLLEEKKCLVLHKAIQIEVLNTSNNGTVFAHVHFGNTVFELYTHKDFFAN